MLLRVKSKCIRVLSMDMLSLKFKVWFDFLLKTKKTQLIYFAHAECWQIMHEKIMMIRFFRYLLNFSAFIWLKLAWEQIFLLSLVHTKGNTPNSEEAWKWLIMGSGLNVSLWLNFESLLFCITYWQNLSWFRSTSICRKWRKTTFVK